LCSRMKNEKKETRYGVFLGTNKGRRTIFLD
jgi:hypothetical protein